MTVLHVKIIDRSNRSKNNNDFSLEQSLSILYCQNFVRFCMNACAWYSSLCLDIVDTVVVLYLYLVKLLLSLSGVFLVVLPVMVKKDEYNRSRD